MTSSKREQNDVRRHDAVQAIRALEARVRSATADALPLFGLACIGFQVNEDRTSTQGAVLRVKNWDRRMPRVWQHGASSGPFINEQGCLAVFTNSLGCLTVRAAEADDLRFEDLPEYRRVLCVVLVRHIALASRARRSAAQHEGDKRICDLLLDLLPTSLG